MLAKNSKKPRLLQLIWMSFTIVPPLQRTIVVIGLTVAGIFELFGLAIIIPLLVVVDPAAQVDAGGRKAAVGEFIGGAFAALGVPMNAATLLLAIVLFFSIKAAVGILVMGYVTNVMASINADARLGVIRTLMQARWSFYTRQRLSRLVAAAGNSSNAVGDAFQVSADLITSLLQISLYLLVCYIIAPAMVLVALAVAAIMAVTYGRLVRNSKRAAKEQRIAMTRMKADLTDVFIGIKSIRAMGRQAQMATLLSKDSGTLDRRMKARVLSAEYAEELQAPLVAVCMVLGLVIGSSLLHIGGHELMLAAILLVRLVNTFGYVQRAAGRLATAQIRLSSANKLIKEAEASHEQITGTLVPDPAQGIRFEATSFKHADGRAILAEADLMVAPGSITVIVGPSGTGKTTTLDLILGLLPPHGGKIILGGVEQAKVDLLQWRRMIGYVPQDVTLFHDTIRNNITLGAAEFRDEDIWNALRAAGADEFVEALPQGLDHVVGERGQMISGGQRQRVALARALLHRPAILILDEATAGLDHETETGICTRIRELVASQGLMVLAVSHGEAWRSIADTIYRLAHGKLTPVEAVARAEMLPLGRIGPVVGS